MLQIEIQGEHQHERVTHRSGPLELGRGPYRGTRRLRLTDRFVSKNQLLLEELPAGRVQVENLSDKVDVEIAGGEVILAGSKHQIRLPVRLVVGRTVIAITDNPTVGSNSSTADTIVDMPALGEDAGLHTVAQPVTRADTVRAPVALSSLGPSVDTDTLLQYFETLVAVHRSAAGSEEFYRQTAEAVVQLVGLDCGMVLLRQGDIWKMMAEETADDAQEAAFSKAVLEKMCEDRRTFYQVNEMSADMLTQSLANISAVVASPVFDHEGQNVIGAVYGARFSRAGRSAAEIRPLEAQLVQVLAAAVGAGLARLESERDAMRMHAQFAQFFPPVLAQELDRDPGLLKGRDCELTVMFCDIAGFSRLSERIGAKQTCALVGDVMDCLTNCIRDHEGVVVSYLGDGLLAMWNAPVEQPGHADLACRAALACHEQLPALSERWREVVGGDVGVRIGINTGSAMVGNMGSQIKLHYGPLGHTVNLASRVEGACKHLGVSIAITGSTRKRVTDPFAIRRLCWVRVTNIEKPVDLYELQATEVTPDWQERCQAYEQALELYESRQWAACCRTIYKMLENPTGEYDLPSLNLVSRAVECLKSPPEAFDPVWVLTTK